MGSLVAAMLIIAGLFPLFGSLIQSVPQPVLGGATLILSSSVATSGIRILSTVTFTWRSANILAASLGLSLGVIYTPEILDQMPLLAQTTYSSGMSTGGICAPVLNMWLPGRCR